MQRVAARCNGVGKNGRHEIGSMHGKLAQGWVGRLTGLGHMNDPWALHRRPGKHSRVLMDSLDSPCMISD
jgi:hypothetical protein